MKVPDPDAPLTPEEIQSLDQFCGILWVSTVASQAIEGIDVPKDMARPDDAIELSNREARRLIYPGVRF